MASDISSYNVQGWLHKLETLTTYEYPFERLKRIKEEYKDQADVPDSTATEKKLEEIKEQEEDETAADEST